MRIPGIHWAPCTFATQWRRRDDASGEGAPDAGLAERRVALRLGAADDTAAEPRNRGGARVHRRRNTVGPPSQTGRPRGVRGGLPARRARHFRRVGFRPRARDVARERRRLLLLPRRGLRGPVPRQRAGLLRAAGVSARRAARQRPGQTGQAAGHRIRTTKAGSGCRRVAGQRARRTAGRVAAGGDAGRAWCGAGRDLSDGGGGALPRLAGAERHAAAVHAGRRARRRRCPRRKRRPDLAQGRVHAVGGRQRRGTDLPQPCARAAGHLRRRDGSDGGTDPRPWAEIGGRCADHRRRSHVGRVDRRFGEKPTAVDGYRISHS